MTVAEDGLPDDLEEVVLARFDELVQKGKVFYQAPKIEIVNREGFQVLSSHRNEGYLRSTEDLTLTGIYLS